MSPRPAPRDVKALLLGKLGSIPERPEPSPPRVDRVFAWDGVAYERWILRGAREPIPAYFLRPEGDSGAGPALLALHPHGRQFETAKSLVAGLVGDGSRAYARAAAKAGFRVLAPDLPAFEDRRPPLAARKRNYALQGEGYERTLAMRALVEGSTLQGWILSDLAACLDALERDPRVDPQRLSALGQSFGGQEVIFGMIFDDRIRAGVASCGLSLLRTLVARPISHNFALYVPGLLPDLDFDVLVPAIAPRPLRVIAARSDALHPVEAVEEVEAAAREAWRDAGHPERIVFRYPEGPHDLPAAELDAALAWLREILG